MFLLTFQECEHVYYCEHCLSQCGHCSNYVTCNSVNGTCPGGWMQGWQTTGKCDKRMQTIKYNQLPKIQFVLCSQILSKYNKLCTLSLT